MEKLTEAVIHTIRATKRGKTQEIETLINEEAYLFAKYLRGERCAWTPRIAELD